jgi:hypothetical protein
LGTKGTIEALRFLAIASTYGTRCPGLHGPGGPGRRLTMAGQQTSVHKSNISAA